MGTITNEKLRPILGAYSKRIVGTFWRFGGDLGENLDQKALKTIGKGIKNTKTLEFRFSSIFFDFSLHFQ